MGELFEARVGGESLGWDCLYCEMSTLIVFGMRYVIVSYLGMSARFEERSDSCEPIAVIPHDCELRVRWVVRDVERVLEYCSAH
jgi:hypothetical protein